MAQNFLSGTSPTAIDTRRILLVKILNSNNSGGGGGGGISSGAGAPVAAPASSPALYVDENSGTIYSYYGGAWH